jgi:hypothetical protein
VNKIDVIDSVIKMLSQRKKDFVSNEAKLNHGDSLKHFEQGRVSGIQAAIDILLDERIAAKELQERLSGE